MVVNRSEASVCERQREWAANIRSGTSPTSTPHRPWAILTKRISIFTFPTVKSLAAASIWPFSGSRTRLLSPLVYENCAPQLRSGPGWREGRSLENGATDLSGLKRDLDLLGIRALVEDGEGDLFIRLVEFVSGKAISLHRFSTALRHPTLGSTSRSRCQGMR